MARQMLTKKQQTAKHSRLRPKPSSKNKKRITDEDKQYLEWLQHQSLTCIVCGSGNVEMHHVKRNSSDSKNNRRLIPLCTMHHRLSNELSAHGTPRKFKEVYPMEAQYEIADRIYQEYCNRLYTI